MSIRPYKGNTPKREALREELFKEQEGLCAVCLRPMTLQRFQFSTKIPKRFATFEHIISHCNGGAVNKRKNLVLSCRVCNNQRGNRDLDPKPALLDRIRAAIAGRAHKP